MTFSDYYISTLQSVGENVVNKLKANGNRVAGNHLAKNDIDDNHFCAISLLTDFLTISCAIISTDAVLPIYGKLSKMWFLREWIDFNEQRNFVLVVILKNLRKLIKYKLFHHSN